MSSSPMDALGQVLSSLGEQFYQYSRERAQQDAAAAKHQQDKDWTAGESQKDRENQLAIAAMRDKHAVDPQKGLDFSWQRVVGLRTMMEADLPMAQKNRIADEVAADPVFGKDPTMRPSRIKSLIDKAREDRNKAIMPEFKSALDNYRAIQSRYPEYVPTGADPDSVKTTVLFDPLAVTSGQDTGTLPGTPKPGNILAEPDGSTPWAKMSWLDKATATAKEIPDMLSPSLPPGGYKVPPSFPDATDAQSEKVPWYSNYGMSRGKKDAPIDSGLSPLYAERQFGKSGW